MGAIAPSERRAIIHAYRHLFRQGLKAVSYSVPPRHVLRRILRSSFRSGSADDFDSQKVANTLHFLQRATDISGIEQKIVKSIIFVRFWEQPGVKKDGRMLKGRGNEDMHIRRTRNEHFNTTLMLLNESLGTCLK